jgi:hypothetical protein
MPFEEENKSKAYEDTEIIVDNDDLIFVKSNSYDSAKYFGPNFVVKNYSSTYRNGDLYFIFDKRDPYPKSEPHIYTIFKRTKNNVSLSNHKDQDIKLQDLIEEFPSIDNEIYEVIGTSDIYSALLSIKNGKEMTDYELSNLDDLIGGFRFKKSSPGGSMVKLKFDDTRDYLTMFDLTDDDIWFIERVDSPYNDFEFEQYDTMSYDWDEGYLIRNFNDENIDKVNEILKFLNPKLMNYDNSGDDNLMSEVSKLLRTKFEREIDNIVLEYTDLTNECKQRAAKEDITNSLCDKLIRYGIVEKYCFDSYYTTVNVLLGLYKMNKNKNLTIKELLSSFLKELNVDGFYDNYYEYYCDDFDIEGFNQYVSRQLDSIIEDVVDNPEYFYNVEDYQKLFNFIFPKYKLDTWYKLERDPETQFKIEDVSHKTNKVILFVKNNKKTEKRTYDLEGFKAFLSTGELF